MDVSENSGFSIQIIHFHRGFPLFSPSILGFSPSFWKHPYPPFFFKSSKTLQSRVLWVFQSPKVSVVGKNAGESDKGDGNPCPSSKITVFRIPTISKVPKNREVWDVSKWKVNATV